MRQPFAHQRIDGGEERGQRLARSGRRCDQHVFACGDRRPGFRLRGRGCGETSRKPAGHRRVEGRESRMKRHPAIIRRMDRTGLNAGQRSEIKAKLGGHRASVRAARLAR